MPKRGTIGIDIGGTKTLFALFDEKFQVVEEIKVQTEPDQGEKAFTKKLTESLEGLLKAAEKQDLLLSSAGVGAAGWVDPEEGTLKECRGIPFLKGYPLRSRVAKATGVNVHIANDVQAGLYGEHQLGAAVGYNQVLGIFFGTGIGGALILDGKPYLGAIGLSGDIGHYVLQPMGSDRQEVLDNVASRTAIAAEAAGLAAKQQAPHLLKGVGTDIRDIKSNDLAEAIQKGDEAVAQVVRSRAHAAGIALSNMVDFLNPELIVLGGGLVEALPKFISDEIQACIRTYSTPEASKAVKVVTAKLKSHAITTGAAKLALDTLLLTA